MYDIFHPCSKSFLPINAKKIDSKTTPPDDKLKSICCDFFTVLELIVRKPREIRRSMIMHNVLTFQRDLNNLARNIHDFTEIVMFNEMVISFFLQSGSMKSKPSSHHAAATPPSSQLVHVCSIKYCPEAIALNGGEFVTSYSKCKAKSLVQR